MTQMEIGEYVTEDGEIVHEGDTVYDYYSMEPVDIGPAEYGDKSWFTTHQPGSTVSSKAGMLNGQRICTLEFAVRRDFPGAKEALEDKIELEQAKKEVGLDPSTDTCPCSLPWANCAGMACLEG